MVWTYLGMMDMWRYAAGSFRPNRTTATVDMDTWCVCFFFCVFQVWVRAVLSQRQRSGRDEHRQHRADTTHHTRRTHWLRFSEREREREKSKSAEQQQQHLAHPLGHWNWERRADGRTGRARGPPRIQQRNTTWPRAPPIAPRTCRCARRLFD